MNEAFCVVRQNLEKVFLLKMRFGLSNPKLATVEPQYNDGRAKGLPKFVRYNAVSFFRDSFSYILLLLLLGQRKSLVIPSTSLY